MLIISATDELRALHPGAVIGLLELSQVENTQACLRLQEHQREVEARLRTNYQGFTRQTFLTVPVLAAYEAYYKRFNKTYHVQLQVESLVLKGKDLPTVSALVDANFAAEVETFVLTAGHDVAKLEGSVSMDVSRAEDQMTQMNGAPRAIRAGDMIMKDAGGICCSILYGQDNRSPISSTTAQVLYVAYAPPGVPAETVMAQLQSIEANVRLCAPQALVEQQQLLLI